MVRGLRASARNRLCPCSLPFRRCLLRRVDAADQAEKMLVRGRGSRLDKPEVRMRPAGWSVLGRIDARSRRGLFREGTAGRFGAPGVRGIRIGSDRAGWPGGRLRTTKHSEPHAIHIRDQASNHRWPPESREDPRSLSGHVAARATGAQDMEGLRSRSTKREDRSGNAKVR